MTPKQKYKMESSQYRLHAGSARAAILAYEHRPSNADQTRERDELIERLSRLPAATKPAGFDRPALVMNDGQDGWSYHLTQSRKRTAENLRSIRREVVRRANEIIEYWAGGWDIPVYSVPTSTMAAAAGRLPKDHLKYVTGGRA